MPMSRLSPRLTVRLSARLSWRALPVAVSAAGLLAGALTVTAPASSVGPVAAAAQPAQLGVASTTTVGGLELENSFVSDVGWVKPGEAYPSRILLTNPTAAPIAASVRVVAARGASFTNASSPNGAVTRAAGQLDWTGVVVPPAAAGVPGRATLVIENQTQTLAQEPTLVWRDLSSKATLTVGGSSSGAVPSHGPKVIPPGAAYETARYGDRPFPVVPVAYTDRDYTGHTGGQLAGVINDPANPGSTFNLYQEMSLGQLYPEGSVPSSGIAQRGFAYGPGFPFTTLDPAALNTCHGTTYGGPLQAGAMGTPLYPDRIRNGVYQLPGQTEYYGSDSNGSALLGAVGGVAALQDIDSACGPTGKLVVDAAALADPEIDYSDFDTDKDGVVDFFMAVFAGCGGNGSSQLSVAGCTINGPGGTPPLPYDNVWPHSSSLEFYYSDPTTGLPGFTTDDQLKDLEGRPLWYTDDTYRSMTTADKGDALKVFVRIGPYNLNPETAIDKASVISHEYGHSLGLPDFYSTGSRETYGDWTLMATDKSQNIDAFGRQELGWVVPRVLRRGTSPTVSGWKDSKEDIDTIDWVRPDGTPYTLTQGADGRVQNSQMYVAKLPGRVLLDPAKFDTGDKASKSHAWWTRSGNDFGCATDGGGHNLDLAIPELADLPAGSTVRLTLKSLFDVEWDYDYGFVLTSKDGGKTFTSKASQRSVPTTTASTNPNQNGCQAAYGNGITGSSASYSSAVDVQLDRTLSNYPASTFVADSFDISDLAGAASPVLRFSYSTDPGLARPGWFIDDLKVTATTPSGDKVLLDTDLETSGGPDDPRIYNGGCRAENPGGSCGQGWQYVNAGAEGPADHAYYLEMRDRSGFDLDGNGEIDRDPIGFRAGLYLAYTDEAHGYGNFGTDDPPAQSPLDATPEPESATPDLNDAAFTAAVGRSSYSDSGAGHTDNYSDPANTDTDSRYPSVANPWRFRYGCLGFDVQSMSGNGDGPAASDGDLTGTVAFTMGSGCTAFDYGYGGASSGEANSAPQGVVKVKPKRVYLKQKVRLSAKRTKDAETPNDLDYSWNLGNGGTTKDATGTVVRTRYKLPGRVKVILTVTDPLGATDVVKKRILVQRLIACQSKKVSELGSWRVVKSPKAPRGNYCDNAGRGRGKDVLKLTVKGPRLEVFHGRARQGGTAKVFVDGKLVGKVTFYKFTTKPKIRFHRVFKGLGAGKHRVRLVVTKGRAYVEGFASIR